MLWLGIFLIAGMLAYFAYDPEKPDPFQERQRQEQLAQKVLASAPVRGTTQTPDLTIVEFGDFQCEYCRTIAPTIAEFVEEYPDRVRHVWIHVINNNHEHSAYAARASYCAQKQGAFWEFHDMLFKEQNNLSPLLYRELAAQLNLDVTQFLTCFESSESEDIVSAHDQFARETGVSSTPYLIINDQAYEEGISPSELNTLFTQILFP